MAKRFPHARRRAAGVLAVLALSFTAAVPSAVEPVLAASADISAAEPPQARRIARPKTSSLEYRLSWGLASIKAHRAYTRGIDGSGITVAMIDAGMTAESMKLFAKVSSASTDLVSGRADGQLDGGHAQQTATLLAAPLDGEGTLGVAYGASLLSIRIDVDGSCAVECYAYATDLARGIDYALAHGVRIIGVPMVGYKRLKAVEPALERAAAAGAVIIAAAGNDGAAQVDWPARYAADPRFRDTILVVGASTIAGEAADWSNKAEGLAERYLVAPGERLLVDCGSETCKLVSGTSYSVAYVAGALSLVMAAEPGLSAQHAARVMLASASDLGSRGVDTMTGMGLLDVSRALRLARRSVPDPS